MDAGPDGGFFEQFIEDYYAECDEHLATARRVLLALESSTGDADEDLPRLQELFRSLHTLKGLSGMVGLASAERVAHALEDALRAVQEASVPYDPPLVDALLAGVELLEQCVAVRRSGSAPPDVAGGLEALARIAPRGTAQDEGEAHALPASMHVDEPPPASLTPSRTEADVEGQLYRFEFVPSQELIQRGINVETVRARLRTLGSLLDARPRVVGGGVAFDFSVAVPPGRAPEPGWRSDGLSWVLAPSPSNVVRAESEGASPAPDGAVPLPHPLRPSGSGGFAGEAAAIMTASVVRVDLARLDEVMRLVGDLVVSRSRLEACVRQAGSGDVGAAWESIDETNTVMERQVRRLREGVMRIRLVPVGEVFERLRFAVRDAARESGKRVALELHGQQTEIDKLVVDRMLEPLLHLVRNAVSHGIESPAERLARGKPPEGRLTLRAAASGDRIRVDVEDDGMGIDLDRVADRARVLLGREQPVAPDTLLDVLCVPGFSTRDEADTTSGRGVGMDVVRSAVRALAGELTIDTTPGRGTRFAIDLPLTLMIVDALMVEVGDRHMAVPQPVLREVLQIDATSIRSFENNEVVSYRGGMLPLLSLRHMFGFSAERRPSYFLVVVGSDAAPVGLLVDQLHGLREIVVQPVVDPLVAVPGVAGATQLGDGRVSLILDAAALLRMADRDNRRRVSMHRASEVASQAGTPAPGVPHFPS